MPITQLETFTFLLLFAFFEGGGNVERGIVVLAAPLPPLLNLINAEKA